MTMRCGIWRVAGKPKAMVDWLRHHGASPHAGWNRCMGCSCPFNIRLIYLDTYMLVGVYKERGISLRNHCGAEPPRDIEPPGLVPTVGGRDRASASDVAADRVKTPASAARGRFRGIHGGRTAPS